MLSGGDERSEPESLISSPPTASATIEQETGREAERGVAAPASALPCLNRNNCIESGNDEAPRRVRLTPKQKLIRCKIIIAVSVMAQRYGLARVGVLTLSFGVPGSGRGSKETRELREQAKEWEFVQKRWHSFCTNVIAKRYADWICVFEQHRDRVWHIHVVVVTKEDIRTGTDIETLSNYRLPYWMRRGKHLRNEALAAEWRELREVCCRYRFGRVELLPVKKTAEAVGHYLGDYLVKTYGALPSGKRCRLVRFSKGINRVISGKFMVHGLGQLIYRTRLKIAAGMLDFRNYEDFSEYFGPRWHYYLRNALASIPIPFRFKRGDFEAGFAARMLALYADDPVLFLTDEKRRNYADASRDLWRRLNEAVMESTDRKESAKLIPGDGTGDGPVCEADLVDDLVNPPEHPF